MNRRKRCWTDEYLSSIAFKEEARMDYNYTVFSTASHHYLFDGSSCNIFNITDSFFQNHAKLFELYKTGQPVPEELMDDYKQLEAAIGANAMQPVSDKPTEYWFDETEYFQNAQNEIHHLMFGVTEQCNMRCRYCVYGGHYCNERTHSDKKINWETLQQGIRFFWNISKNSQKAVNFYGGEPFLEFENIKRIVAYIESIAQSEDVQYYITTNGTLLDSDIGDWFASHNNVNLFVSLAGAPHHHDMLRVRADGAPTYQTIRKNLLHIREKHEREYKERVNFVFNIFDEIQLKEVDDFMQNELLFDGLVHLPEVTFIDCVADDGYVMSLRDKILKDCDYLYNPLQDYIARLKNGDYENIVVSYYDDKFIRIHRRVANCDKNIITGACRPFAHKLFVDTGGNINFCENFVTPGLLGTVDSGIDWGNTRKLLETYRSERTKTCGKCWQSKMCALCYRDLIRQDGLVDRKFAAEICEVEKNNTREILKEYCTVLENDNTLLDRLDSYIVNT